MSDNTEGWLFLILAPIFGLLFGTMLGGCIPDAKPHALNPNRLERVFCDDGITIYRDTQTGREYMTIYTTNGSGTAIAICPMGEPTK